MKPVYATAFFIMGIACFLYALAGAIWMLVTFRLVFAVGVAASLVLLLRALLLLCRSRRIAA